jgi:hypothetical protein
MVHLEAMVDFIPNQPIVAADLGSHPNLSLQGEGRKI